MKRICQSALILALAPLTIYAASTQNSSKNSGNNASSDSISPATRAQIESVVHDYLIAKPEVLVEAMQVLQNRQVEQAKQSITQTQKDAPNFAKSLFQQPNDPIAGNKDGKITVVEFFDYQCPHCVEMKPVISDLLKSNPNVRFVFKDWPIRGPVSEFAARAALAANKQGKYLDFHNALLGATQPLTQDMIIDIAQKSGLNVDQLKKDMNDPSVDSQLKNTMKLAQDLKLFGTPAFFIGPTGSTMITYVPGQLTIDQINDVINKAGNKSQ